MTITSFSKVKSPSERFERRTRTVGFGLAGGQDMDGGFDDASVSSPPGGSVVAPLKGGGSSIDVFRSSEGSGTEVFGIGISCVFDAASASGIDNVDAQG